MLLSKYDISIGEINALLTIKLSVKVNVPVIPTLPFTFKFPVIPTLDENNVLFPDAV